MAFKRAAGSKPPIVITRSDHEKLARLAESHMSKNPDIAEELLAELDRARIVEDGRMAVDVVQMGMSLHFTTDLDQDRQVSLVYPGEADIAKGKISVLTPIGVALIGLSTGQSIDWTTRNGRVHRLTVQSVDGYNRPAASAAQERTSP